MKTKKSWLVVVGMLALLAGVSGCSQPEDSAPAPKLAGASEAGGAPSGDKPRPPAMSNVQNGPTASSQGAIQKGTQGLPPEARKALMNQGVIR